MHTSLMNVSGTHARAHLAFSPNRQPGVNEFLFPSCIDIIQLSSYICMPNEISAHVHLGFHPGASPMHKHFINIILRSSILEFAVWRLNVRQVISSPLNTPLTIELPNSNVNRCAASDEHSWGGGAGARARWARTASEGQRRRRLGGRGAWGPASSRARPARAWPSREGHRLSGWLVRGPGGEARHGPPSAAGRAQGAAQEAAQRPCRPGGSARTWRPRDPGVDSMSSPCKALWARVKSIHALVN